MICLQCDNEQFLLKEDAVVEQEFRNEIFQIQTPAMACSKCGWVTLATGQVDRLRRRTADEYRKKHDLLTSEEIKGLRQLLSMNQRDFALFLGVGEASVKRWETWLIQEKSSDELIRLKCHKQLYEQLARNSSPGIWIACKFPITKAQNGITIEQPANVSLSRWVSHPKPPQLKTQDFLEEYGTDDTPLAIAA